MTSPASVSALFQPLRLGELDLANRIVMAPLTRCRVGNAAAAPDALQARYYAQRAGAGLIVSEGTIVSPQGRGYPFTPGIWSAEQGAGWRLVTDAVHAAGGRIVCQLWHCGRLSLPEFHGGAAPVAPSAIDPQWKMFGSAGLTPTVTPRALASLRISSSTSALARGASTLRRHLHQEARAEELADQGLEHDVDGEILLEIVGRAHDGLDRLTGTLPDPVLEPGLLAEVVVPALDVHADLGEVQRDVLGEAKLVGRIGQGRVVDHLGVAVALGLHQRGADQKGVVAQGGEPLYKIFTTEFDEIVQAEDLCDAEELTRLRAYLDQQLTALSSVVSRLANKLQRRLLAQQNRAWTFDLEEGMLDVARLTRVIIDPTAPLSFKQEEDQEFRDTVVTLLLDNSGSMRGRPITVAAMCADTCPIRRNDVTPRRSRRDTFAKSVDSLSTTAAYRLSGSRQVTLCLPGGS